MTAVSANADLNLARTRLRLAALDQWAAVALVLAEKVVAEARRDLGEAVRVLFRIAQAARLAVVLAMRLSYPDDPAFQPVPAKPRAPRTAEAEALAEKARTEDKSVADPERRVRLGDREVSDDAILRRPLKDIVRVICRNLGVVPDWSLWSDENETPKVAPPEDRPPPASLRDLLRPRLPGRRLIWISPSQQAPAPWAARAPLRCSASPLALDPRVA